MLGRSPALFVFLRWKKAVWSLWDFNSGGLLALVSIVTAHCVDQDRLYFLTIIVV